MGVVRAAPVRAALHPSQRSSTPEVTTTVTPAVAVTPPPGTPGPLSPRPLHPPPAEETAYLDKTTFLMLIVLKFVFT